MYEIWHRRNNQFSHWRSGIYGFMRLLNKFTGTDSNDSSKDESKPRKKGSASLDFEEEKKRYDWKLWRGKGKGWSAAKIRFYRYSRIFI